MMSGEVDRPIVGSRVTSFSLRMVESAASISSASCSPLSSSFMFVVAQEVRDRCVVTSAATAT